jgi:hypothetical protein
MTLLSMIGGSNDSKRIIVSILYELGRPASSYDIEYYMDEHKDVIKNTGKSLGLRQIQRILEKLERDTIVGKMPYSHKYFILDKNKESVRYFADIFGVAILNSIMTLHFPTIYTMKHNLKKLVEIFGLYVVYCFLEAARPIEKKAKSSSTKNDMSKKNDMLSYSVVKNIFDPHNMYLYFLSAIKNQVEDPEVKKFWTDYENDKKRDRRRYPSNSKLTSELFKQITTLRDKYPIEAYYLLNKDKIDKVNDILLKEYPVLYKQLQEAREGYTKEMARLGNPNDLFSD